jgi:hypothetical protein
MSVQALRIRVFIALALAAFLVPSLAAAQGSTRNTAAQAAVSVRTQVAGIRARLEDLIEDLDQRSALTATQTASLRRELVDIFADLEELEASLATSPAQPTTPTTPTTGMPQYSATWKSYLDATLRIRPQSATFNGWRSNANIQLDYGDAGQLLLTVNNVDYTATWTINKAYTGSVKTSVESENDGDVIVTVQDAGGTHQYMVKDGGIGPIYARATSVAGAPATPGSPGTTVTRWYTPYREAVRRGTLEETRAMEWFIQQFQDNAYVSDDLQALGELLGDLTGVAQSGPVAYLSYVSGGRQQQVRIPDPRRNPGTFAEAMDLIYGLDQDDERYIITLAE